MKLLLSIDYRTILLCIVVGAAFTAIQHQSKDAPMYSLSFFSYRILHPVEVYEDLGYSFSNKSIYPVGPVETSVAKKFYALRAVMALNLDDEEDSKDTNKDKPANRLKAKLPTDLFELKFNIEVTIVRVNPLDSTDYKIDQRKVQKEVTFICYSDNPQSIICPSQTIVQVDMPANLKDLSDKQYFFILKWVDPKALEDIGLIYITLEVLYGNEHFFLYLGHFKNILSIFAFLAWINYVPYLVKTNNDLLSYERKCVAALGFFLIAYTQTLSEHVFPLNSPMLPKISIIAISAISALIILLWLLLIERLASKDNAVPDRSRMLISLIALAHFTVSLIVYYRLGNHSYKERSGLYAEYKGEGLQILMWYIFQDIGMIVLVTVITILRTSTRLITILYKYCKLEWRDRIIFSYSLIFTAFHILFTVFGNLQVNDNRESTVVKVYGMTTLYVILLLVLYIPPGSEIAASTKRSPRVPGRYGKLDMSDDTPTETDIAKAKIELGATNYAQRNPDQSEETL